jgi:hypothetical protein
MLNRYQQPCLADWSDEQKQHDRSILRPLGAFAGLAVVAIAFVHGCTDGLNKTATIRQREVQAATTPLTSEQEEYRKFFAKHGSPAPVEMAKAVTAAKPHNRPVLAAVAVVESSGNPRAIGDGGDSIGAWQIQPKHWGLVSSDPAKHALKAEAILEALVESRGRLRCYSQRLRASLAAYNGGNNPPRSAYRYADRILKLAGGKP